MECGGFPIYGFNNFYFLPKRNDRMKNQDTLFLFQGSKCSFREQMVFLIYSTPKRPPKRSCQICALEWNIG